MAWRWIRRTIGWLGDYQAITTLLQTEFVRLLLAPVFGIVTTVLGVLQGIPWMWVAVGGAIGFAGFSHGLLRFDEWVERTNPEGKLIIRPPLIVTSTYKHGDRLKWVQIYMIVKNIASFSVEYEIIKLRTFLDGRVSSGFLAIRPNFWFLRERKNSIVTKL